MVAMPFFSDWWSNAKKVAEKELGVIVDVTDFTAQELQHAIDEVLTNTTIQSKVDKMSRIIKDRPMNAQDTAAYWIDHVMKFGSDHLTSHGYYMPWYQFVMPDVGLAVTLLVSMGICMSYTICKLLLKYSWVTVSKEKRA